MSVSFVSETDDPDLSGKRRIKGADSYDFCPDYFFSGFGSFSLDESIQLDKWLRSSLSCIFDMDWLTTRESIRFRDILYRKVNILYFIQDSLSKRDFLRDVRIRTYFGTDDTGLLGDFYDFIEISKAGEVLSQYGCIDDIGYEVSFLGSCKLPMAFGEVGEKFILHMLEREIGSYFLMNSLFLDVHFPASMVLHRYREGDMLTSFLYSFSSGQRSRIISELAMGGILVSDGVDLDRAFLNALEYIWQFSIDINSVTTGSDRLTLIVPVDGSLIELDGVTQFFVDRILARTYINCNVEYKLSLSHNVHYGNLLSSAQKILGKGYDNQRFVLGELSEYPAFIRSNEDFRYFADGLGLGRIDRLGRDWMKVRVSMGVNRLFRDGVLNSPNICDLNSSNACNLVTDEFLLSLCKLRFGIRDLNLLTCFQRDAIDRLIVGFVRKMENSIAQHQLIEFMRSGRWFEPKNLGYGFPLSRSSLDSLSDDLMTVKYHRDLIIADIGLVVERGDSNWEKLIMVPLRDTYGNSYNGIIDRVALFGIEKVRVMGDMQYRFGITKYLGIDGEVRYFEDIDLFSIRVDPSVFSCFPLKGQSLQKFREYQGMVFQLIFQVENQGHETNFLFGHWIPEFSILSYGGICPKTVDNLQKRLQMDFPVTFNDLCVFNPSIFMLKWSEGVEFTDYRKIIEVVHFQSRNPVVLTEKGDCGFHISHVESLGFEIISRITRSVEYMNRFIPKSGISSTSKFLRHIIPEMDLSRFLNGTQINRVALRNLDADTILEWFGRLPLAHQSNSRKHLPSPLGGLTSEIYSGQEPPIPLIDIVMAVKDGESLVFVPFNGPTGQFNDFKLMCNRRLSPDIAKRFLSKFKDGEMLNHFLGAYFFEVRQYLDENAIYSLETKYDLPTEIGLIHELKKVAAGKTETLIPLSFKKDFEHLKQVYIWFDPMEHDGSKKDTFTIQDLRLLPGQFPRHPSCIDPAFGGTKWIGSRVNSKCELIFMNKEKYNFHVWLEAQLQRILIRLTLDAELLLQNFVLWCNTRLGNSNMAIGELFGETNVFELSKRYLAPGSTLVFDMNVNKMKILQMTGNRPLRNSAFLTPVFIMPKCVDRFNKHASPHGLFLSRNDPVFKYRTSIESFIQLLPTLSEESILEFTDFPISYRVLRIFFEKT